MQYLVLFLVALAAWLIDASLQAVYYFGMSPFGTSMYGSMGTTFFGLGIYYNACFFVLLCLPAFIAMSVLRIRAKKCKISEMAQDNSPVSIPRWVWILHATLCSLLVLTNHIDHEILRYMGTRYTVEMLKTYNIFSQTTSFVFDALRTDERGPFSSAILLLVPIVFFILLLVFRKRICNLFDKLEAKVPSIASCLTGAVIYIGTFSLIISAISVYIHTYPLTGMCWDPSKRQALVSPIIIAFIEDVRHNQKLGERNSDFTNISSDIESFQKLWLSEEADSNWQFTSAELPLLKTYQGTCPQALGGKMPNIVIIFLETTRAMNLPDFNPEVKLDPMPFLHSVVTGENEILKKNGMKSGWFSRYMPGGLPTVDAQMVTHIGIPAHSYFTVSSTFLQSKLPSFTNMLRNHGYDTTFIDSAYGGFTNWDKWVDRWYDHFVDLNTKDDKVTMDSLGDHILAKRKLDKPYLITAITISNHEPFEVPNGGTKAPDDIPFRERIQYTLRYEDEQLKAFFERMDENNALADTIFIILGDHGYSLGDIPSEQFWGENYNSLRYNVAWVPLIILSDIEGLPVGEQKIVASHADLAPTILDAVGICDDNSFVGHSLVNPKQHHVLVNKENNFLIKNDTYGAIFVHGAHPQLFRTDDLLEKNELGESQPDVVEQMKQLGLSYRHLVDYVYETKRIATSD